MTPNWSSRMFGTTCSGRPILSSRLYETMYSDVMEYYRSILLGVIMCVGKLWLYFRNAWRETIIEALRFMKCVLFFISFVKCRYDWLCQEYDWCQHLSTDGILEPYFLGGLGVWYPLRSLKPPIERRPCCCCIFWCESMPLELQCRWHDVSVTGVLWRTSWWKWFRLHRNLRRFSFDEFISMQ